jgi:hypothetical protein
MTYIYKWAFNYILGSTSIHVSLNVARLNDATNMFFDDEKPRDVAQGYLDDIQSLLIECGNTFNQVKSEVFRDNYLGGSPIPNNDIPQLPPGMITNSSGEEDINDDTISTPELSNIRINNLIALSDVALENVSFRQVREAFIRYMPKDINEPVRISISTNYAPIQFLPIENMKFIQQVLGSGRRISVIFDPLIL